MDNSKVKCILSEHAFSQIKGTNRFCIIQMPMGLGQRTSVYQVLGSLTVTLDCVQTLYEIPFNALGSQVFTVISS